MRCKPSLCLGSLLFALSVSSAENTATMAPWTAEELSIIDSLSLDSLPDLPADASNKVADSEEAARFGRAIFFDPRFSANGQISCSTCHIPDLQFTDGLDKGRGIGESARHTMTIMGTAYSPWLFWDGRRDSLWAQALAPLEDPVEHGGNRLQYVHLLHDIDEYRQAYEGLFGAFPETGNAERFPAHATPLGDNPDWQEAWAAMAEEDRDTVNRVFANMGKVIAAYESTVKPQPARFDEYAESLRHDAEQEQDLFNDAEKRGLRLFIGEAACIRCHNGPLLSNNEFHNTGVVPYPGERPDLGRSMGLGAVLQDPFNCLGEYSDAEPGQCAELLFVRKGAGLIASFRTPTLRNIAATAPYMHKGQFKTLGEVLQHYNQAAAARIGHNEAEPLGLSQTQLDDLEAFLLTLSP